MFSDLGLLLTKYYKERLNPQLKKGKNRQRTDHILTKSTRLQLSINCTSYTNLTFAKSFFFIFSLSSLSFTSFINLFISSISSYNFSYHQFHFKHILPINYSTVTSLSINGMKSSLKQEKKK